MIVKWVASVSCILGLLIPFSRKLKETSCHREFIISSHHQFMKNISLQKSFRSNGVQPPCHGKINFLDQPQRQISQWGQKTLELRVQKLESKK